MKIKRIVRISTIAGLYILLTIIFAPISFKTIQVRISESLTLLPFLTFDAVWGLFIGCFISNFFSPFGFIDVIFGSLLTLISAYLTFLLRKSKKIYLAPLPPILLNGFGVSFYITLLANNMLNFENFNLKLYLYFSFTILIGEAIATYLFGLPLTIYLSKLNFFKEDL